MNGYHLVSCCRVSSTLQNALHALSHLIHMTTHQLLTNPSRQWKKIRLSDFPRATWLVSATLGTQNQDCPILKPVFFSIKLYGD